MIIRRFGTCMRDETVLGGVVLTDNKYYLNRKGSMYWVIYKIKKIIIALLVLSRCYNSVEKQVSIEHEATYVFASRQLASR